MQVSGQSVLVTGGASGLGLATARRLAAAGARVTIADLRSGDLPGCRFVEADVTRPDDVARAVDIAAPLRAVVHTAGRGGPIRLVGKDGKPGDAKAFADTVSTNLVGSFVVASTAAAAMARLDPVDGERGVIVLTASAAAWEGQIGQAAYASSKAGVVGLTLVAARDLASRLIRVCTIAPGLMDTPMLAGLREDIRRSLAASVPNPARLGDPAEYALLAESIIANPYLNGETIRLDGALRMGPR